MVVQEKRYASVDVMRIPEASITMLKKRGDELDKILLELFGEFEDDFEKPESSLAARLSGPADGRTDVEQPSIFPWQGRLTSSLPPPMRNCPPRSRNCMVRSGEY